jgi:hypothetical protein
MNKRNVIMASIITIAVIVGVVLINRNRKGMASTSRTTKKRKISITPKLSSEVVKDEFEKKLAEES